VVAYRESPCTVSGLACLWVRTAGADGQARVLPDACSDLVWSGGTSVTLAGPDTSAWPSSLRAGRTVVGARFAPGAGGGAVGFPLAEVRDTRIPFAEIEQADEPNPGQALERLAALAARLLQRSPPDPAIAEAARRLRHPRQRIDRLAGDLGLSERQLRRRCLAAAGYGPKTLQRVLRFQAFLAADQPDLARRALDAGYADQAHLTRDCTALAGLPPAALLRVRETRRTGRTRPLAIRYEPMLQSWCSLLPTA
jgi:AraC-like DNA-binding protein